MTLRSRITDAAAALDALDQPLTPTSLRRAIMAQTGEDAPGQRTIARELDSMAADGLARRIGEGRAAVWTVHQIRSTMSDTPILDAIRRQILDLRRRTNMRYTAIGVDLAAASVLQLEVNQVNHGVDWRTFGVDWMHVVTGLTGCSVTLFDGGDGVIWMDSPPRDDSCYGVRTTLRLADVLANC